MATVRWPGSAAAGRQLASSANRGLNVKMNRIVRSSLFERMVQVLLLAAAIALLTYHIAWSWCFTVDDAFITFRYAENLVQAHRPVFNTQLAPAEGCTTFLWMLIMAIPHAAGLDAVVFAKVAGVIAFGGVLSLSFLLTERVAAACGMARGYLPAMGTVCLLAAYAPASIHAVSGMETMLFAMLLLLLSLLSAGCIQRCTKGRAAGLVLVGLLLGLTRPEGNLVAAVMLVAVFVLIPRQGRLMFLGAVAIFYVIPGVAYFLWRASYYGHLLPLPFYIKVSSSRFAGRDEVAQFLAYLAMHVGVLVVLALAGLRRAGARQWLPALIGGAALVGFFVVPEHIMGYEFRYLFPAVPVVVALAGAGLAVVLAAMEACRWRGLPLGALAVLAIVASLGAAIVHEGQGSLRKRRFYGNALSSCHVALGKKLYELRGALSDPTLAVLDAGAIPYYSKWTSVDTYGLNDAHIATTGSHDPAYVLSHRPAIVVVVSCAEERFDTAVGCEHDRELYQACLQDGYEPVKVLPFEEDGYYLWVLCKPDSALYRQLEEWR